MKIEWRRGFFRAWAVLALAWITLIGWNEYGRWANASNVHTERECWDRLAKWPDGTPFRADEGIWALVDEFDTESNVEINKKNHEWAADSIPERNRWRDTVRQRLRDCEVAKPLTLKLSDYWPAFKKSLSLIFFPPLALLIAGFLLGWIVRGFRATT